MTTSEKVQNCPQKLDFFFLLHLFFSPLLNALSTRSGISWPESVCCAATQNLTNYHINDISVL